MEGLELEPRSVRQCEAVGRLGMWTAARRFGMSWQRPRFRELSRLSNAPSPSPYWWSITPRGAGCGYSRSPSIVLMTARPALAGIAVPPASRSSKSGICGGIRSGMPTWMAGSSPGHDGIESEHGLNRIMTCGENGRAVNFMSPRRCGGGDGAMSQALDSCRQSEPDSRHRSGIPVGRAPERPTSDPILMHDVHRVTRHKIFMKPVELI